jgi:Putative prokaryotic signal transducing protein
MSNNKWEIIAEVFGELEGELIRGLLEAGGIEVFLNQEGAGRAYGLNVGSLGKVQVMVPSRDLQLAQEILDDYDSGNYASPDSESAAEDPGMES